MGRRPRPARLRPPTQAVTLEAPLGGSGEPDAVVASVLDRLGARRSGWNAGDVRGEVEQIVAMAGVVADDAARRELAEDLTSRALAGCVPLLTRAGRARARAGLDLPTSTGRRGRPHTPTHCPCRLGNSGTRPARPGGSRPPPSWTPPNGRWSPHSLAGVHSPSSKAPPAPARRPRSPPPAPAQPTARGRTTQCRRSPPAHEHRTGDAPGSRHRRLFTAPQGGPLRARNWRTRVFDVAVKRAGLASQQRGDMLRPHDLRHTCASLHIKHGTPPKVLSDMLGHASVAITLDRYGHLYPGDAHLYVDRLGEVALAARADYLRTDDVSTTPTGPEEDAQNGV